jgi:hypothetical protein
MYTVTLIPIPDMPYFPKQSSLISTVNGTTRIKFVVSYVPYMTDGGFKFKALSRQIGENGQRLPGGPLIDLVIGDIFSGRTVDRVTSFFQKLILVECGLWYKYQNHSGVNDDSVDIKKWVSWFSDVSRVVPLSVSQLDSIISSTIQIPESTSQLHLPAILLPGEQKIVQAPPIPDSSKKRKAEVRNGPAPSEIPLIPPPVVTQSSDADGLPFFDDAFADGWALSV